MDLPPSRYSPQSQFNEPITNLSSMSTLTMRPSLVLPSPRHLLREDTRFLELPSRARSPTERTEKVELPSIRRAIPEIQLQPSRGTEVEYRSNCNSYSPSAGIDALSNPSEYFQSPQRKRRRLSADDDDGFDWRNHKSPRIYRSPPSTGPTPMIMTSPTCSTRRASSLSCAESWTGPVRTSPYIAAQRLTEMRSATPYDSSIINRSEWRPTLPSLPSLTLDRGPIQACRARSSWSEYALEATRSGAQTYAQLSTSIKPLPSSYHPSSFAYGYQQPRRQSHSGPPSLSLDQTPFSIGDHHADYPGGGHPYVVDIHDGSDGKQRKRRGNLPKETTDKLRAWFVAHLQHPYPTEDEKQDLMRQTGLQMNQISNWFINARRRQLPAMINNARVESDARSAQVGERGDGRGDYGDERDKRVCLSLGDSDGEGSYDDEYDTAPRHVVPRMTKGESI